MYYEFEFGNPSWRADDSSSSRSTEYRREVFFIPERIIPDSWYETMNLEASFEIPELRPFRIVVDAENQWLAKMHEILQREGPTARSTHPRPVRISPLSVDFKQARKEARAEAVKQTKMVHSTARFAQVSSSRHQQFWHEINNECAHR